MALSPLNGVDAETLPPQGDAVSALAQGIVSGVGPGAPSVFRGPLNLSLWASYNTPLTTTQGSATATVGAIGNIQVGTAVKGLAVPPGTTVQSVSGNTVTLALPTLFYRGKVFAGSTMMGFVPDASAKLVGATVSGYGIAPGTTVIGFTPAPTTSNPSGAASFGLLTLSQPATLEEPPHATPFEFAFALSSNAILSGTDPTASFTGSSITYTGSVQLERSFDGGQGYIVGNSGGAGALAVFSGGGPISLTFAEAERNVVYRLNCTAYTAQSGVTLNYRLSQTGPAAESLSLN